MTYQIIYDFIIKHEKDINDVNKITSEDINEFNIRQQNDKQIYNEINTEIKEFNEKTNNSLNDSSLNDYFSDSSDDEDFDTDNKIISYKIESLINEFLNNVSLKVVELNDVKRKFKAIKSKIVLSSYHLTINGLMELLNKLGKIYHPRRYVKLLDDVFKTYKDKIINNIKLKNSKFKGFEFVKIRLETLEDCIYMNNEIISNNIKNIINEELKNNDSIKSVIETSINVLNYKNIKQVNKTLNNYSYGFNNYINDVKDELNKNIESKVNETIKIEYDKININDKINEQLNNYKNDNSLFVKYLNNLDIQEVIKGMLKTMINQNINMILLNDKFKNDMVKTVNSLSNKIDEQHNKFNDWIKSNYIKQHHNKYLLNKTLIKKTWNISTNKLNDVIKSVIKSDTLPEKILMTRDQIDDLMNELM